MEGQLVLELYYWEELSMAELSEVLEITRSAAINRVHRARAALRDALTTLADAPGLADQTIAGFDTWAAEIRGRLPES